MVEQDVSVEDQDPDVEDEEAGGEGVKFHTVREQKGTTAQPSSVQPRKGSLL